MTPASGLPSNRKDNANRAAGSSSTVALSAARLAAVQALYQMTLSGSPAQKVIGEFLHHRLGAGDEGSVADADRTLFVTLVEGVATREEELDSMIDSNLANDWNMDRIQPVLLAVLRAGAFELLACGQVPPRVVITEYVDIAHAFLEDGEPAFVNAVLDRLAHVLREDGWETSCDEP